MRIYQKPILILSLFSSQAFAHGMGDYSGDYFLAGPTIGYCQGFNYGAEASVVRVDNAFYGVVADYSRHTGAGLGIETGASIFGTDLMVTSNAGLRARAFVTVGIASVALGCSSRKGCEVTAMFKLGKEF